MIYINALAEAYKLQNEYEWYSIQGHRSYNENAYLLMNNLSSNSYPRSVVKRFILFELLMMMLSVHLSVHQYLFNTNFRGCSCWVVPLSFMSIESQFLTTYCIDRSLDTKIHVRIVKLWFSLKPRKLIPTNVNKTIVFYKHKISMLKMCCIPFLLYQVQWLQHYHNEPSKLRIDFNRYRIFW